MDRPEGRRAGGRDLDVTDGTVKWDAVLRFMSGDEELPIELRDKAAFVGGPYRAPRVPKSGFLRCRLRGRLKVGGYTDEVISWPVAEGRIKKQLIVCGDLVRALKTESRVAIKQHWGISLALVSEYRRALGIERYTAGSWRLFWRNVNLARTDEARAKLSSAHEGRADRMTPDERAKLRRIQKRPKPEKWKKRMSRMWKDRIARIGMPIKWLPEELAMFGIVPDREIARITGRSLSAVKARKFLLLKEARGRK